MIASLLLAVAAGGIAGVLPTSGATARPETASPCCFAHSGYQGVCVVVPGENETCAGILDYLNTPNTAGRTYCNSSRLRGGWEIASCSSGTPQSSHAAAAVTAKTPPLQSADATAATILVDRPSRP
jgi:hypothetical protein